MFAQKETQMYGVSMLEIKVVGHDGTYPLSKYLGGEGMKIMSSRPA
jgi:hypothetical protein